MLCRVVLLMGRRNDTDYTTSCVLSQHTIWQLENIQRVQIPAKETAHADVILVIPIMSCSVLYMYHNGINYIACSIHICNSIV